MSKNLFDHINEERRAKVRPLTPEEGGFVGDEFHEFAIYDCPSKIKKKDLTLKKPRKIFAGEPITVRFIMRNPLMTEIYLSSIKIVCQYEDSEIENEDCYPFEKILTLKGQETKEVIV